MPPIPSPPGTAGLAPHTSPSSPPVPRIRAQGVVAEGPAIRQELVLRSGILGFECRAFLWVCEGVCLCACANTANDS
eukprot:6263352-Amphidinium_carterae.5